MEKEAEGEIKRAQSKRESKKMKREQVRQSETKSESASRREQKQRAVCRGKRCGWVNRRARLSGPERGAECCALSAHKSFQKASAFRHGLAKWHKMAAGWLH